MNTPNKLTLLRMILVPVMVLIFYLAQGLSITTLNIVTTLVFIIAACTDFLDGYLARKNNQVTDFGKFMDPLADKALVLVALILIVDAKIGIIPYVAPLSLIIMLIRELVVSGLRLVGANKGVVIAADKLGKLKTITQDIAIPVLLLAPTFAAISSLSTLYAVLLYVGDAMLIIASIISLISGGSYLIKNKELFKEAK